MKTEYYNEIKQLIADHYQPVNSLLDDSEYVRKKTLSDVYKEIANILPSEWIHQSSVYEALQELGFKSFVYTFPAMEDKPERTSMVYLMETKTAAI